MRAIDSLCGGFVFKRSPSEGDFDSLNTVEQKPADSTDMAVVGVTTDITRSRRNLRQSLFSYLAKPLSEFLWLCLLYHITGSSFGSAYTIDRYDWEKFDAILCSVLSFEGYRSDDGIESNKSERNISSFLAFISDSTARPILFQDRANDKHDILADDYRLFISGILGRAEAVCNFLYRERKSEVCAGERIDYCKCPNITLYTAAPGCVTTTASATTTVDPLDGSGATSAYVFIIPILIFALFSIAALVGFFILKRDCGSRRAVQEIQIRDVNASCVIENQNAE